MTQLSTQARHDEMAKELREIARSMKASYIANLLTPERLRASCDALHTIADELDGSVCKAGFVPRVIQGGRRDG